MTLCIAWRNANSVQFISDSRVSDMSGGYSDMAVKVTAIPVAIRDPRIDNEVVYDRPLGLCFAGQISSAYAIQQTLTQLMSNLAVDPIKGIISFDQFAILIREIYQKLATEYWSNGLVAQSYLPEFVVCGYCPEEKILLARHFFIDQDSV